MHAGDDIEGYMYSLSLSPPVIKSSSNVQYLDVPFAEDEGWADYLLIDNFETLENNWNFNNSSSDDPLSEYLNLSDESDHAASLLAAAMVPENGSPPVDDFQVSGNSDNEELTSHEENSTHVLWSKQKLKNAFRPTYNEDLMPFPELDGDLFGSTFVTEQPIGDIFQVWDLGFEAVENDWIKQLDNVIDESSSETQPLGSASSTFPKRDVIDIKIEDIISGMEDLSLNRFVE